MALPITGGSSQSIIKYNAKTGRWRLGEQTFNTITMIADLPNIEVGWLKFGEGQSPDFIMVPASDVTAGKPFPKMPTEVDAKGKPAYRRGFRLKVKVPDRLVPSDQPTVRELASNSLATCRGVDRLHDLWLAGKNGHDKEVPVVRMAGIEPMPGQYGENQIPVFEIVKFVPRPQDLDEPTKTTPTDDIPFDDVVGEPEQFDDADEF